MNYPLVLVAGATGAIGSEVVSALQAQGTRVRVLVREPSRLSTQPEEVFVGNLENARTLEGVCEGVDAVVSTAGASLIVGRFGRGQGTFFDVDDKGNRNLLRDAVENRVKRFAYVSVYGGRFMGMVEYIRAHESFAAALRDSALSHLIVRPTTTFSRFASMIAEAKRKHRIRLTGTGLTRTNPIHEGDVAMALVNGLNGDATDLDVGGPEVLTREEIANLVAAAVGGVQVQFGLTWRAQVRAGLRRFTGRHNFDVALYRLAENEVDTVAPSVGARRLSDYFASLS